MYLSKLILAIFLISSLCHGAEDKNISNIETKLKIIVPKFKQSSNIQELLKALQEESAKHDPDKKGITIIYRAKGGENVKTDVNKNFSFDFEKMPVGEIIRYICISSGLKYKVEEHAIIIANRAAQIDELDTRFYSAQSLKESLLSDQAIIEYFKSLGVLFPTGAKLKHVKNVTRLVITNTAAEQIKITDIMRNLESDKPSIEKQLVIIRHELRKLEQIILDQKTNKEKDTLKISKQLQRVIPKVRFEDRTLDFVIDYLRQTSKKLDPENEGLNIILKQDAKKIKNLINIDADDIPIGELIKYICDQMEMKFKVEKHALIISK